MARFFMTIIFCLFFFSACSGDNLGSLYDDQDFKSVYERSSLILKEKLDDEALYYEALSANRLGLYEDAVTAARLYALLFNDNYDEARSMEKLVLHYGERDVALSAGESLLSKGSMDKEDLIQFYKVLMDNGLYTEANIFLEELSGKLTKVEYAFCLINGNAPIWQIINSIAEIYNSEGCSQNYLSAVRLAISKAESEIELESMELYLEQAFDGNTQFALIIGDFFYNLGNRKKMEYYWNLAKKDFPEAVDTRLRISNPN